MNTPTSTPEEEADAKHRFPLATTAGREDREDTNAAEETLLLRHHDRPRRSTGFLLQCLDRLLGPLFSTPGEDLATSNGSGHRNTAETQIRPVLLQISARTTIEHILLFIS
jgi:hypothetical protein